MWSLGPLTFEARLAALDQILAIQAQVCAEGERLGRPGIDILNAGEEARIRELIAAKTWPNKWTGDEPRADQWLDAVYQNGWTQPILFRELVGS